MRFPAALRVLLFLTLAATLPTHAASLEWTLGTGDGRSLYQEANWIDPSTGITPPAGTVDPNTPLDIDLITRAGGPGGGSGAGGNLLMGTGSLAVANATLRMNRGQSSSIDMGTTNRDLTITDSHVLTHAITNGRVTMHGRSELTLYGADPLTNTTIDLRSSDCFVYFLDRRPTTIDGSYLNNFRVDGRPAVLNTNVQIRQYYNGAVIRANPPGNIAVRAFDLPDLKGDSWNLTTGFKGIAGLGSTTYDAGSYAIAGWGNDIWSDADQCHFAYRTLRGDGEIIARANRVANTHTWAKGGPMIRASLDAGAPNIYAFQRPDGKAFSQVRTTADANTTSTPAAASAASADWLRLTRSGNTFTSYRSTTGANGPWTELEARTITMPTTAYIGIAATSHIGVERGNNRFTDVAITERGRPVTASGDLGHFTATREIAPPWPRDNQTSSFLIKKGYMVTVAEHPGGQGASRFYAATEDDLLVDLPPELDNKISFMRILPWRWIAKRGWAGSNGTHMTNINAYWNYEWEPTGNSNLNREFVPMIKGRGQNRDFRWEEVRVRGNQTHFLGFNEPESANQGDLTVDEAIALWPKAQQLGLRLGSPGRTDNTRGNNWLREFMTKADQKGYRVDYICVHNYAARNATQLKNWLDAEFAKYNRPIWLTEFQRDVDSGSPTAADHQAYLAQVVPMLESLPYLERYAYYNFNTANPSNGFASLFNGDVSANAKGLIYGAGDSNPGYRNTGQPAWATATITLPTIIDQNSGQTATVTPSLDPSVIDRIDLFADGQPISTDISTLSHGLHTLTARITTTFGELLTSSEKQIYISAPDLTQSTTGQLTWSALPGEIYRIEKSPDLKTWTLLETRTATTFTETATDPRFRRTPQQYYRITRQ